MLTRIFCENPLCQHHRKALTDTLEVLDLRTGVKRRLRRHEYGRPDGSSFYLCCFCRSSVEFVKSQGRA